MVQSFSVSPRFLSDGLSRQYIRRGPPISAVCRSSGALTWEDSALLEHISLSNYWALMCCWYEQPCSLEKGNRKWGLLSRHAFCHVSVVNLNSQEAGFVNPYGPSYFSFIFRVSNRRSVQCRVFHREIVLCSSATTPINSGAGLLQLAVFCCWPLFSVFSCGTVSGPPDPHLTPAAQSPGLSLCPGAPAFWNRVVWCLALLCFEEGGNLPLTLSFPGGI